MVDYYALPQSDERAWPGRAQAGKLNVGASGKAVCVEKALQDDLAHELGKNFDARRFVPFVVMHEFEGLLFSDCAAFSRGISRPELEPKLRAVRNQFQTPEEINDSPVTAPSKRVEAIVSGYEKPLFGALAALEIGLTSIRDECPHFADWLRRLESVAR
jgi:hypothetical protein